VDIRPERDDDRAAIYALVEAAFQSSVEARLVDDLRDSADFIPDLSLVAEDDGDVVGHVMTTWIGSALVHATIDRAQSMRQPMIVLQGAPAYYSRFGFEAAEPLGVTMDLPDWAPREAAQLVRLGRYDPSIRGRVIYPPAFDATQ
jgi:putative acetyltransferase